MHVSISILIIVSYSANPIHALALLQQSSRLMLKERTSQLLSLDIAKYASHAVLHTFPLSSMQELGNKLHNGRECPLKYSE